jgi:hypothetical protein
MPSGIVNLALGLAIQVGSPGPSETPNAPFPARAFGQYGFEGSSEPRLPSDSQMSWLHGYHQEIPAYGGHPVFRPYNYKDVLAQSQTAAGWGERPAMPYSQQFWHKYHDQATMLKLSRAQTMPSPYIVSQPGLPQQNFWTVQPGGIQVPAQQVIWTQPGLAGAQNTILVPSNLPDATQLPMSAQPAGEFNQLGYRK